MLTISLALVQQIDVDCRSSDDQLAFYNAMACQTCEQVVTFVCCNVLAAQYAHIAAFACHGLGRNGNILTAGDKVCVLACTHACKSNALGAAYVTMHTCTVYAADHSRNSARQHHKGQPGVPRPGAVGELDSTNSQVTLPGLVSSIDRVVPVDVCCMSLAQNRSGPGMSRSLRMGMAHCQRRPR